MNQDIKKTGIIFDLDGTLWDASCQVVPAWNIVLARYPELKKQITESDMKSYMGKRLNDIATLMLPEVEEERRMRIMQECCKEEQIYLSEHGGILYPNLEQVLVQLQEYSLYIVSNCQDGYVQSFFRAHGLEHYFSDIEMSGRTGKTKAENITLLMKRNQLQEAVYVGDTALDATSAKDAGIPFVHARYGFGTVLNSDMVIDAIDELPQVLEKHFNRD